VTERSLTDQLQQRRARHRHHLRDRLRRHRAGPLRANEGFIFQNASNADLTATITNNTVSGINGTNIFVGETAGNATASSLLRATISGNTMTPPAPANRTLIAFLSSTSGSTARPWPGFSSGQHDQHRQRSGQRPIRAPVRQHP
jgi:hypothetical protein